MALFRQCNYVLKKFVEETMKTFVRSVLDVPIHNVSEKGKPIILVISEVTTIFPLVPDVAWG